MINKLGKRKLVKLAFLKEVSEAVLFRYTAIFFHKTN